MNRTQWSSRSRERRTWRWLVVLAAAVVPATVLPAQRSDSARAAARLDDRVDARTRGAVLSIVDSAGRDGLPTDPLVSKALEGALKHADGDRIVGAVRRLALDLGVSRSALGDASRPEEIVAGAAALRAGISRNELAAIHEAAAARGQGKGGQGLTVALATLSDLVGQGVPVDTASGVVAELVSRGATDDDLLTLRRDVRADAAHGVLPEVAASVRGRAIASVREALTVPQRPVRRPAEKSRRP